MLTCTAPIIPMVLFATALLVRAALGAAFPGPAYPDSYYYVHVGEQLAAGYGFTADYIWNFVDVGGRLPADPTLPIPSNAHWMPLAAMVQAPFLLLFGKGAVGGRPGFLDRRCAGRAADLVDGARLWFRARSCCGGRPDGRGARRPGAVPVPARQLRPVHDPRRAQPVALCPRRSAAIGGHSCSAGSSSVWLPWRVPTACCSDCRSRSWRCVSSCADANASAALAVAVGCAALFAVVGGAVVLPAARRLWLALPVGEQRPDPVDQRLLAAIQRQLSRRSRDSLRRRPRRLPRRPGGRAAVRTGPVRAHAAGRRARAVCIDRRMGSST